MKTTKKIISVMLAFVTACLVCGTLASCKKSEKKNEFKVGVLSYLNVSEEKIGSFFSGREKIDRLLEEQGYLTVSEKVRENRKYGKREKPVVRYYDSLDALLMALKSGEIDVAMGLPQSTAKYICAKDDRFGRGFDYNFEKLFGVLGEGTFAEVAFNRTSDGFSFMFMEKNKDLCDQFNDVINEMKKDGSMKKLMEEHILKATDGRELKPLQPENKPGRETIKVAVTGDLPPMDYIASDGTFAGFNTALLTEIGKRLNKNITLVQVTNLGRAAALASGTVDVAFWTRSAAYSENKRLSPEEFDAWRDERRAKDGKEGAEAMKALNVALGGSEDSDCRAFSMRKDMPEGTIITIPYFQDMPVGIALKK